MNTSPVVPFTVGQDAVLGRGRARYPDLADLEAHLRTITSQVHTLDAAALAEQAGSGKAINMVMLGCLVGSGLLPVPPEDFLATVEQRFAPDARRANRNAFAGGVRFSRTLRTAALRGSATHSTPGGRSVSGSELT